MLNHAEMHAVGTIWAHTGLERECVDLTLSGSVWGNVARLRGVLLHAPWYILREVCCLRVHAFHQLINARLSCDRPFCIMLPDHIRRVAEDVGDLFEAGAAA